MTLKTIEKSVKESTGVMLYFEGEHCNVCHALKPKLFEAFEKNFPEIERVAIDVASHPDIAAHFGVFSIPTAIIFLDSKEFARVSRNVSIASLIKQIERPYRMIFS